MSNSLVKGASIPTGFVGLAVGSEPEGIEYRRRECWPYRIIGRDDVGRSLRQHRDAPLAIIVVLKMSRVVYNTSLNMMDGINEIFSK